MQVLHSDQFFGRRSNHLIHLFFPSWRPLDAGVWSEVVSFFASAVLAMLVLIPLALIGLLVFNANAGTLFPYVSSCVILSALSIALAFRLAVLAFNNLRKPLNWICPALLFSALVPVAMLGFDAAESVDPALAGFRAMGLNRSYFGTALLFLPFWIVPMILYFKRLATRGQSIEP